MILKELLEKKVIKIHTANQRQILRASDFTLSKIKNESLDLKLISLKDLKEICEKFAEQKYKTKPFYSESNQGKRDLLFEFVYAIENIEKQDKTQMKEAEKSLASRMSIIAVGFLGISTLAVADLFVDYRNDFLSTIFPIALLVGVGLIAITTAEFYYLKWKQEKLKHG